MIALMLLPPDDATLILNRAENFRKLNPSFEASYQFTGFGSEGKPVRIRIKNGSHLRFWSNVGLGDYEAVSTPSQWLEIDRDERLYMDVEVSSRAVPTPDDRHIAWQRTLPPIATARSIFDLFPPDGKKTVAQGVKTTYGTSDVVKIDYQGQMGSGTWEIAVGSRGEVTRFKYRIQSMQGATEASWDLVKFKSQSFTDADFKLTIPENFSPQELPFAGFPESPFEVLNLEGWTEKGQPIDLKAKIQDKVVIVAYLDSESPSKAAVAGIENLRKAGMTVVVLNGLKSGTIDAPINPDGKSLTAINPPAFPFFVLVDKQRKIRQYWQGYKSSNAKEWQKSILDATQRISKSN